MKQALRLGIGGPVGSGKTALVEVLCKRMRDDYNIAVVTNDIYTKEDQQILIRADALTEDRIVGVETGGCPHTAIREDASMNLTAIEELNEKFQGLELVIIESVGIGQSEIEVQRLSDHTVLVMQPLAGDQVQFMKAGIMEVPDTFVINKCDEDELAKKSKHLLSASLKLAKIHVRNEESPEQSIFMTSATKRKGIQELMQHLLAVCEQTQDDQVSKQEHYFLNKWIQQAYGEFGLSLADYFNKNGKTTGTFEQKELKFKSQIANFLTKLS